MNPVGEYNGPGDGSKAGIYSKKKKTEKMKVVKINLKHSFP